MVQAPKSPYRQEAFSVVNQRGRGRRALPEFVSAFGSGGEWLARPWRRPARPCPASGEPEDSGYDLAKIRGPGDPAAGGAFSFREA